MKYRMYIDEVGDASMKASLDHNNRYLSLTGVIFELDYVDKVVAPEIESLKRRYFKTHVDDPIIFHRKEMANRVYPFGALLDEEIESRFNVDILSLMENLDYTVVTVVIDKLDHWHKYNVWRYDPYHYCLLILVERFTLWLESRGNNLTGDMLAESRGGKQDRRLKDSYTRLYENGSDHVSSQRLQQKLSSRQLKVKPKINNIAGLQLADLFASPSHQSAIAHRNKQEFTRKFGAKVVAILKNGKYYRGSNGQLYGYGVKWLP